MMHDAKRVIAHDDWFSRLGLGRCNARARS